jgi:AraC-like DNA-binding protein
MALQQLAKGEPITNIAFDLGYESSSAFSAMFRRMLGASPRKYLSKMTDGKAATKGSRTLRIQGERL